MTTEATTNPKWKRASWLALRIYAGVCTLLVSAYLALVLWSTSFFTKPSPVFRETDIMALYGRYVSKESPKRADYFLQLATALGQYSREASVPVPAADMFKYLGKPDLIAGTEETGSLVYLYEPSGHHE